MRAPGETQPHRLRCTDGPLLELLRVRLGRDELVALDARRRMRRRITRSELVRQLIREASPIPPPPPDLDELLAAATGPLLERRR